MGKRRPRHTERLHQNYRPRVTRCSTCANPRARKLLDELLADLRAEQAKDRLLNYPHTAMRRIVSEHVPGYQPSMTSFRRHLRNCIGWHA